MDQEYRHLIKGPERKIWERSFANDLGQLAQRIREVNGDKYGHVNSKIQSPQRQKGNLWQDSLQDETIKGREGAHKIDSGKLVRVYRKSKRPHSISHHSEVCL